MIFRLTLCFAFLWNYVTTYSQGALQFNGVEYQYVDCGQNSDLNLIDEMTIEMWFYWLGNSLDISNMLLNKEGEYQISIRNNTGEIELALGTQEPGNWSTYLTGINLEPSKWYHISTILKDAGNTLNVEVMLHENNSLVDTYTHIIESTGWDDGFPLNNRIQLGAKDDGSTQNIAHGIIDEVRIWNLARTPQQIEEWYQTNVNIDQPGLVALYSFSEGTGSLTHDPIGNHQGILVNSPSWVTGAPLTDFGMNSADAFSDEFDDEEIHDSWIVVNQNQDALVEEKSTGKLLLQASPFLGGSDMYSAAGNYNAPRILQPVNGNWAIECKLDVDPTFDFQSAGIHVLYSENPLLTEDSQVSRPIERVYGINGNSVRVFGVDVPYLQNQIFLRLEKSGNVLTAKYSSDGNEWTFGGTQLQLFDVLWVGLHSVSQHWNGTPAYTDGLFDYFRFDEAFTEPNLAISSIQNLSDGQTIDEGQFEVELNIENLSSEINGEFSIEYTIDHGNPISIDFANTPIPSGGVTNVLVPIELMSGECHSISFEILIDGDSDISNNMSTVEPIFAQPTETHFALKLESLNDYLELPHNNTILFSPSFTFESWINLNSIESEQIFSKHKCTDLDHGNGLAVENGYLLYSWSASNSGDCGAVARYMTSNEALIDPGKWYHVAVTHTGNEVKLFVNGDEKPSTLSNGTSTNNSINTRPFRIGVYEGINGTLADCHGSIDEARLWSSTRSQEEIQNWMCKPLSEIDTQNGLIAVWHFGEGIGATAFDGSNNFNNGALINGAGYGSGAPVADVSYSNDISVLTSLSPTSGCQNTSAEPVVIRIKNSGTEIIDELILSYSFNGGGPVVESIDSLSLGARQTLDYLFAQTANLTLQSSNEFVFTATLAEDQNMENNELTIPVFSYPPMFVQVTPDTTLCAGTEITLAASGGDTYTWNDGQYNYNQPNIVLNPQVDKTYYVTIVNAQGCVAQDSVLVEVNNLPVSPVLLLDTLTICPGEVITLQVTNPVQGLFWSTGELGPIAHASQAGSYTVVNRDQITNCQSEAIATVNISALPQINDNVFTTLCSGDGVTLTVENANTALWSSGENTLSIEVAPTNDITYFVTATNVDGCTAEDSISISVNNAAPPGDVLGMYPLSGSTEQPTDISLSFAPVTNASLFDYYVYPSGETPEALVQNSNSINLEFSLESLTNYDWFVVAKNSCESTHSDTLSFQTIGEVDLTIDTVVVQSSTISGATIPVEFTVSNIGTSSTGTQLFDVRLWLSTDIDLRNADDQLLEHINNLIYLQAGQSYTQTVNVTIPGDVTGTWYLFVIVDNDDAYCGSTENCLNNIRGHHNSWVDESVENNNHYYEPITITPAPAPDLRPSLVGGINNVIADNEYNGTVTVLNQGNFTLFESPYKMKVWMSEDDVLSTGLDEMVLEVTYDDLLDPGQDTIHPFSFTVPYDLNGGYYLFVQLDTDDDVEEYVYEGNNIGMREDSITVFPPAFCNLHANSAAIVQNAFNPYSYNFNSTAINNGFVAPYESTFRTDYYLSRDNELDTAEDWLVTYKYQFGADALDSSAIINQSSPTIQLPQDSLGVFYPIAFIDGNTDVLEADETDNVIVGNAFTKLLIDTIDFTIDVDLDASSVSGTSIPLHLTIGNNGPSDPYFAVLVRVYRNNAPGPNLTQNLVSEFNAQGNLILADSYETDVDVSIPIDYEGPMYFVVHVDYENQNYEWNGEGNNTWTGSTNVSLTEYADLRVVGMSYPDTVHRGETFALQYTIANDGEADAIIPRQDRVILYSNTCGNPSGNVALGDFTQSIVIPAGGSDTFTANVQVPYGTPYTDYHVIIRTDFYDVVFEHLYEDNNTGCSGEFSLQQIVVAPLYTDVLASWEIAPDSTNTGSGVSASVAFENTGTEQTDSFVWHFEVRLSTDSTFSNNDIFLYSNAQSQYIFANTIVTTDVAFNIPNGLAAGTYYLIVRWNSTGTVQNDDYAANNDAVVPIYIELTAPGDLVVLDPVVQSSYYAGQSISLDVSFSNIGLGQTFGAPYRNKMYLNNTPDLVTPILLSNLQRTPNTANGETYTMTMNGIIPGYLAGNYYLIVQVDANNNVYEHDLGENNNLEIRAVNIEVPLPTNLSITGINHDGSATLGAAESVTMTILNEGPNQAVGLLGNLLKTSENAMYNDADDELFANLNVNINLGVGQTQDIVLSGIPTTQLPGLYHLVGETNTLAQLYENDFSDNFLIAENQLNIGVTSLVLEELDTTDLNNGDLVYYKLVVPANDLDVLITLNSLNQTSGANLLYLRKDAIPTTTEYDAMQVEQNEVDVKLLLPSALAGTYYLMAKTNSIFPESQEVEILARALEFQITEITPNVVGQGPVTTTIYGAGFDTTTVFALQDALENVVETANIKTFYNSMSAKLRWNLSTVIPGQYTVIASDTLGNQVNLDFLTVQEATGILIGMDNLSPDVIKTSGQSFLTYMVQNNSNIDIEVLKTEMSYPIEITIHEVETEGNCKTKSEIIGLDSLTTQFNVSTSPESQSIALVSSGLAPGENFTFTVSISGVSPPAVPGTLRVAPYSYESFLVEQLDKAFQINEMLEQQPELFAGANSDLNLTPSSDEDLLNSVLQFLMTTGIIDEVWYNEYNNNCPGCISIPLNPGDPIGSLQFDDLTIHNNQIYNWQINNLDGEPGQNPGWDAVFATGPIEIDATDEHPAIINVGSINLFDELGVLDEFNNCLTYTWPILISTDTIIGFDEEKFLIISNNFESYNYIGNGAFSLILFEGKILSLRYTPDCSALTDPDTDGDGYTDSFDLCPVDPGKHHPGSCGCDYEDADTDSDGTPDCLDGCPNNPYKVSPGDSGCAITDADSNEDGIPDYMDWDNDGVMNGMDGCMTDPLKIAPGTCGCGVPDTPDCDNDDTDDDGTPNGQDQCPLDPNKTSEGQCGCGSLDTDSDGDGVADCNDLCPFDSSKTIPGVCDCNDIYDSDEDGTVDCLDLCPYDPYKTNPGHCGCGYGEWDNDGDGYPNCIEECDDLACKREPGECGCEICDVDSDGDGVMNCHDACPFNYFKVGPGICGCNNLDNDYDQDGWFDCEDQCPQDPNKYLPGDCGCGFIDSDPCVSCGESQETELCGYVKSANCALNVLLCLQTVVTTYAASSYVLATLTAATGGTVVALLVGLALTSCAMDIADCFDDTSSNDCAFDVTFSSTINLPADIIDGVANGFGPADIIIPLGEIAVCEAIKSECQLVATPCDPNEVLGPLGSGSQAWATPTTPLNYQIYFENDSTLATAPAQRVEIRLPIDSSANIYDFRLGSFGWGSHVFEVPVNSVSYSQLLDLVNELGLKVQVTAGVDIANREAFWIFESLDPNTLLPPYNPMLGFLAINDSLGNGQGFVSYSIKPLSTTQTGDEITAQAEITFDINDPILTNVWLNTIDAVSPSSTVSNVSSENNNLLSIAWEANDDTGGSGVRDISIYIKENDGEYELLASEVNHSPYLFNGVPNTIYSFVTTARDTAGNVESFDENSAFVFTPVIFELSLDTIGSETDHCVGDVVSFNWTWLNVDLIDVQLSNNGGNSFETIAEDIGVTLGELSLSALEPSSYLIRLIASSNSSIISNEFHFEVHPLPFLTGLEDQEICINQTASVSIEGGTSYDWQPDENVQFISEGNYEVQVDDTLSYLVTGEDSFGCFSTEEVVFYPILPPVIPTLISPQDQAIIEQIEDVSFEWTDDGSSFTLHVRNVNWPIEQEIVVQNIETGFTVASIDTNGNYEWFVEASNDCFTTNSDTSYFNYSIPVNCLADFNQDGIVNIPDLYILIGYYSSEDINGDITSDGVIDIADMNAFLTWYGTICN